MFRHTNGMIGTKESSLRDRRPLATVDALMTTRLDRHFEAEAYDRACAFLRLIERLSGHPLLSRLSVMGGTAFSLWGRELTRLPVDLDFVDLLARDQATVVADRPRIASAMSELLRDLAVDRATTIQADVHFLVQTPLWPPARRDSLPIDHEHARQVLVVDDHDLAASKLLAVMQRSSSRDLFDAREHLRRPDLDRARLRTAFVVYGSLKEVDWRAVRLTGMDTRAGLPLPRFDLRAASVDRIATSAAEVSAELLPLLRFDLRPAAHALEAWVRRLIDETRALMAAVLPLEPHERAFLDRLHEAGEIVPELLTANPVEQATIRKHPGLLDRARARRSDRRTASEGAEDERVLKFRWRATPRGWTSPPLGP
jgi:hypothetical protein